MKIALEQLGYKKVYHFSTVDEDPSHTDLWIEALKRKYEPQIGKPPDNLKTDWGQILENYDVRRLLNPTKR
jgi:Sulfotransferase domain